MSHFFAAIEDLFKSVFNLFAGVFNTIANVFTGLLTMILNFFTSLVDLVASAFSSLNQIVSGLGHFVAGNIVFFGLVAAGIFAYQRFVIQPGRQPAAVTQAKKKAT